jgi:hypothetical protein
MDQPAIARLGHEIGTARPSLRGYATVTVAEVQGIPLAVEATPPPPRHAEISGWPSDLADLQDAAQRLADVAAYEPAD